MFKTKLLNLLLSLIYAIVTFACIYFLSSLANGTIDCTLWPHENRVNTAGIGGLLSGVAFILSHIDY